MSELTQPDERIRLPEGWGWAEWSGTDDATTNWKALDLKVRLKLEHRFMEIVVAEAQGQKLAKEKHFTRDNIGKAKVRYPSPGVRAWEFRDGPVHLITHIAPKEEGQHDAEFERATKARAEHLSRKAKKKACTPPPR